MKQAYPRYGKRTAELEARLNHEEKQVLQNFLDYCATAASPKRVATKYKSTILQFRDVVEKPLMSITAQDAIRFWGMVNTSSYGERTKVDIKRAVKRFLKWYYRDLEMIEPLKVPSTFLVNNKRINKATLITPNELKLMLHRAEKLRDKTLLILLYETAARPQEVRDLKWGEINWQEKEVHLYSRKTKQDRDLPLHESWKHLKRWKEEWIFPNPQEEDYIFPATICARPDRTRPISVTYINRVIKSLAKKAGIQREVYTYLLRHTRLTEIRKLGVQGIEFKKFAGHVDGSMQEAVYVHLDNEDMKQSVIEKVYKVHQLKKPERDEYKDRIDQMERQLREVVEFLKETREEMRQVQAIAKSV